MEKPCLEVVVISDEDDICQKRQAPALEQEPVYKKLRRASPIYPMDWEPSLPPVKRGMGLGFRILSSYEGSGQKPEVRGSPAGFVASNLVLPAVQSVQRCKKPLCRKVTYNPYDFTSDELDPVYEWPRESSPRRTCKTCGVDVVLILQHTLGQFPLGLRLDKLEAMVWKEHRVRLANLSLEQGYWDILKFLETVPGIRLTLRKGTARCLVQLKDQRSGDGIWPGCLKEGIGQIFGGKVHHGLQALIASH